MPTMKRRIVYLSDEQWAALHATAQAERTTISDLIRGKADAIAAKLTREIAPPGTRVTFETGPVIRRFTPVPKPSQKR